MLKVVIDRTRWLRGEPEDSYLLRSEDGKMCCLGFAELAAGATPEEITDSGAPSCVAPREGLGGLLTPLSPEESRLGYKFEFKDSKVCGDLMNENDEESPIDDDGTSDDAFEERREVRIAQLGAQAGIFFTFVN
jgi:hypothetical protein